MGFLNRQQILELNDTQSEIVAVPEWGGDVMVRGCSAAEQEEYELSLVRYQEDENGRTKSIPNYANSKARLVVRCVFDEAGNRLFSDADADVVGKKSNAAIDRIFKVIQKLNGRTPAKAKEVEKN